LSGITLNHNMNSVIINTKNYKLRPFKKEDAVLWQIWDVDEEVQAHMPEPKNKAGDISEQYDYIDKCATDPEGYYWSIETLDGVAIGTVALFEINIYHQVAELGIVIGDKNFWGRGVATEVITKLIEYAFDNLNIQRISAEVEEKNIPMVKVFEKVGFEQDGIFKQARIKNRQRINVLHFGILKQK